MNREILFRAKAINRNPNQTYRTNYKNGDWVYGLIAETPIETSFGASPAQMTNEEGIGDIDVDFETLCQYTGLEDRNGTKIFEGDIVGCFCNTQIFEVKWCDIRGGYFLDDVILSSGCEPNVECLGNLTDTMQVLGNIYDNPELLKGE